MMTVLPGSSDALATQLSQEGSESPDQIWLQWLYSEDGQKIKRYISKLVNGTCIDAEDLYQDVCIILLIALRTGRYNPNKAKLLTYARKIARNRLSKIRRALSSQVQTFSDLEDPKNGSFFDYQDHNPANQPDALIEEETRREIVINLAKEILNYLTPHKANALKLKFFDELPGKVAAKVLNISHSAYRQDVSRAYKEVQAYFPKNFEF